LSELLQKAQFFGVIKALVEVKTTDVFSVLFLGFSLHLQFHSLSFYFSFYS